MRFLFINVSGSTFEVSDKCLERFPDTLLGDPCGREKYYIGKENMYFFDRHRLAFEGILMYYQSYGRVVCPENVPDEVFQAELEFFRIDCEFLREAHEAKKYISEPLSENVSQRSIRFRIWKTLKDPASSPAAQVLSLASLMMTITSIILVCINSSEKHTVMSRAKRQLYPLELTCFTWFTVEYILRLWSSPSKLAFLKNWIDTTDLFTLVVFYSSLAVTTTESSSTSVLRILRLANAFRVFRLTRFSNGLRLLIFTVYKSRSDLQLLGALLFFFILISSCLVYYAESNNPHSDFRNGGIFDGIWFCIISCTTVGYGDLAPRTTLGKLTASVIITFGAMFILLPVLKLVNSFNETIEATRAILSEGREEQKVS